jgi:hypothetical protein
VVARVLDVGIVGDGRRQGGRLEEVRNYHEIKWIAPQGGAIQRVEIKHRRAVCSGEFRPADG